MGMEISVREWWLLLSHEGFSREISQPIRSFLVLLDAS